jgi:hypothetical protein
MPLYPRPGNQPPVPSPMRAEVGNTLWPTDRTIFAMDQRNPPQASTMISFPVRATARTHAPFRSPFKPGTLSPSSWPSHAPRKPRIPTIGIVCGAAQHPCASDSHVSSRTCRGGRGRLVIAVRLAGFIFWR